MTLCLLRSCHAQARFHLTLIMSSWQVCHTKDEHWVPATPAEPTVAAAPGTAQGGSSADSLFPALFAKLAASLAGAAGEQPRGQHAGSRLSRVTDDVSGADALQQQRRQLSQGGSGKDAAAAPADTGAEQPAESTPREQGGGSSADAARKLDLSAYKRGPAARLGVAGTDPTVCSLRCEQTSADSELKKVR